MLNEGFERLAHYVLWNADAFSTVCLTEGYKKRYISSNLFENSVFISFSKVSGSSSVVEHRLAKARVASSSLVSRSTKSRMKADG